MGQRPKLRSGVRRTTVLQLLPQGGTTLQPSDDLVWSRFASRDLFHHRNVRIDIFSVERLAVGFQEQPDGEKSGSLVAVRQRVIPSQMLDQHRRFLDQRGICVLIAKARLGRGKRRLRKRDSRQAGDLLRGRPEHLSGDLAVIA